MAKRKKKTLAQRKALPNNEYWVNKCKDIFMPLGRGEQCQVCGVTEGTVFHHIVSQSRSKFLRFDLMNVVVLCPKHHTCGNALAPHSTNSLAVGRYIDWLRLAEPEKVKYCEEREHVKCMQSYRDIYEELVERYS